MGEKKIIARGLHPPDVLRDRIKLLRTRVDRELLDVFDEPARTHLVRLTGALDAATLFMSGSGSEGYARAVRLGVARLLHSVRARLDTLKKGGAHAAA